MFHAIPINGDSEFGDWAGGLRIYVVFAELRDSNLHGLIQALGVPIDAVENAVRIGERNAAMGTGHPIDYITRFAVCSPQTENRMVAVGSQLNSDNLFVFCKVLKMLVRMRGLEPPLPCEN